MPPTPPLPRLKPPAREREAYVLTREFRGTPATEARGWEATGRVVVEALGDEGETQT